MTGVLWHLLTPAVPLHELTHALVALPWASNVETDLQRGDAEVRITWRDETPLWAVYLAHLAPMLVGLGLVLVAVATIGVPSASSLEGLGIHEAGLLLILACNWAIYSFPSYEDRHPLGSK
ncbi:hypothetical protein [Haloprofundus halobius]|uniref:hypothetical protein n=1 Tax=Haloprofundus halobius TaxID=2876194 RepID=UPI001CCF9588|nr:hypothetical protein [Haloprofundus halobius]